ncbi:MAG: DUF2125 domain-containing protein [Hyphomonadaceae bacterium]
MKANRLWLIIPWALFIAAALGWMGYWHYVANTAEQRLRAWAAAESAEGGEASFAAVRRQGFPALLRLELRDFAYAPRNRAWRAATERADLHIDLLNPRHIILQPEAAVAVSRSGGALTNITADAMIVSVETDSSGVRQAGLEANNIVLDDPAEEGVLRAARIVANVRPDPRAASDYQLAFDAESVTLPRPVRSFEGFGLEVARLRAAIVVTQGATLGESAPGDALGPWTEAGGRTRFEALELHWGPLETSGAGDWGLDAERRLQGALTLPIEEPGPVFQAIANAPETDANARQALGLLAAGYTLTGDGLTLDVAAANGVLTLEGLRVRDLPPVY